MKCKGSKGKKGGEPRAQLLSREYLQSEEVILAHQLNGGRWKRKRMTILVSSTTCILERERHEVVKGDANRNISKRRKSTPVITTMDLLMKAILRWFQIDRPQEYGLEHLQRLAAAVNHGNQT
jgi:hypothetical protein